VHELKEMDNVKRVKYCRWFRDVITAKREDILDVTFFTDEAWFHLSRYVNRQNSLVWSTTNPHEIQEQTITLSEGWCVMHHITKLDNLPPYSSITLSSWNVIVK
jgi:hypothetical protein